MTRIILSILTIAVVMASATAATLAFFQTTQSFSNELSTVTSSADATFVAVLTTDAGTPTPFTATLNPGETLNRCLWIRNTGGVPARFKVYMQPGSEVGDTVLGDALRINAKDTPETGRCTSNPSAISGASGLYTNFDDTTWTNVLVRGGGFYTATTTPFKTLTSDAAMNPNQYTVWQFDMTLPEEATSAVAGKTYTFQGELFAVEDGGALDPTPAPTPES